MKLVFFGTPAFAVPVLQAVHSAGHEVLAVVTQPDRPRGRKKVLTPPETKVCAQAAVKKACLDSVATLSAYFANQHIQPLQFDYGSAPIARIKGETRMQILLKLDLSHIQNGQVEKIYRLFDGCVFEDCTMIMETDPPNLL